MIVNYSWAVFNNYGQELLCHLSVQDICVLVCHFEHCLTFTHQSFVERTLCRVNLWLNGHTGTLMANHIINWGRQIRHKHAHTHTHKHTYYCCQMKSVYLQDVNFSWGKKNCLGFIFSCCCFLQWGFECVLREWLNHFVNLKRSFFSFVKIKQTNKQKIQNAFTWQQ